MNNMNMTKNNKGKKLCKTILSIVSGILAALSIFFLSKIIIKANDKITITTEKSAMQENYENYGDPDQSKRIHAEEVFEAYCIYLYDCYNEYTYDDMDAEVGFYDINDDGTDEMIISYGHGTYDWTNEFYTYNDYHGTVEYIDEVSSAQAFYEAEDGNGLYMVRGIQGFQIISQLTMNNDGDEIYVEEISESSIDPDEEYYSNDYPIEFIILEDFLCLDNN